MSTPQPPQTWFDRLEPPDVGPIDDVPSYGLRLQRALTDKFNPAWRALHDGPPEILFHYTDTAGFKGIVESSELWASNARYLNDESELAYLHELIQAVHESIATMWQRDLADRSYFLGNVASVGTFLQGVQNALRTPPPHVYLSCFCAIDDLLSQWRSYGASQGGFSIGFAQDLLGAAKGPSGEPVFLGRVIYDRQLQERIVSSLVAPLAHALDAMEQIDAQAAQDAAKRAVDYVAEQLAEAVFSFKNPGFREEEEWRLVLVRPENSPEASEAAARDLRFRVGYGTLIPYVALAPRDERRADRLPIRSVRVGPSPYPSEAWYSADKLLQRDGYGTEPPVPLNRSEIRLRR